MPFWMLPLPHPLTSADCPQPLPSSGWVAPRRVSVCLGPDAQGWWAVVENGGGGARGRRLWGGRGQAALRRKDPQRAIGVALSWSCLSGRMLLLGAGSGNQVAGP